MKEKAGECRHRDCIYRNQSDALQSGQCNYWIMTGHCRIVGLTPKEQEPRNCPRYVPDGRSKKDHNQGKDWHEEAERLYNAGLNDREIAEKLGCCVSSVWRWRNKYELFPQRQRGNEDKRRRKP